jgi:hypothetical protein
LNFSRHVRDRGEGDRENDDVGPGCGLGHLAPAASSYFMAGSLEAFSKGFADISSSDDRDFLLHDCNFRRVLMQAV